MLYKNNKLLTYLFSSFASLNSIEDNTSMCFILLYRDLYNSSCGKINKIPYKVFIRNLFFFGSNKCNLISI